MQARIRVANSCVENDGEMLLSAIGRSATATGVVSVLPITEGLHPTFPRRSTARGRSRGVFMMTSPGDSLSSTVRSIGFGTMRSLLGTTFDVPENMIIPLERLHLGDDVLGRGTFGEVVRGELNRVNPLLEGGPATLWESHVPLSCGNHSSSTPGHIVSYEDPCKELDPYPKEWSTTEGTFSERQYSNSSSSRGSSSASKDDPSSLSVDDINLIEPHQFKTHSARNFLHQLSLSTAQKQIDMTSNEILSLQTTMHPAGLTDTDNTHMMCQTLRTAVVKPSETNELSRLWKDMISAASEDDHDNGFDAQPVAVKRIDKARLMRRQRFIQSFQSELRFASTLCHPFIINVHGVAEDASEFLLIMDMAECGTLEDYIKTKGLKDMDIMAPRFLADIVLALEYLQVVGVAHRDIKSSNLLLTEDHHVVVADFGSACYFQDDAMNTFAGSAAYMSPEMVSTSKASTTSDLWALGCVLFELFIGHPPFQGENRMFVMRSIKEYENDSLEYPPYFPADAKNLVQRLLQRDPADRLGSEATGGFKALKAHSFFAGIDWKEVSQKSNIIPSETNLLEDLQKGVLKDGEKVVHHSMVLKESHGTFKKAPHKRLLVLTDFPRLFYVDMSSGKLKGRIPIRQGLHTVTDASDVFRVVVKGKTYVFRDLSNQASVWSQRIHETVKQLPTSKNKTTTTTTTTVTGSGAPVQKGCIGKAIKNSVSQGTTTNIVNTNNNRRIGKRRSKV